MQHYDVIVIGVGSMGSATCYHLAKKGARVLGLEQFDIPHDQGSHAGQSRIIRKAYFEHPDYVPLLELAYRNWRELEAATGTQLYVPTGLLYMGSADHPVIRGVQESARQYSIDVHKVAASSYPQLQVPSEHRLLLEPDAGFVTPERSVLVHTAEAIRMGADIRTRVKVESWKVSGGSVTVETNEGVFTADKLVITAGPWASKLVPVMQAHLTVTRQTVAWVMPEDPASFALGNLPCWLIAEEGIPGVYYGFPMLPVGQFHGPIGFKLAHHAPAIPCNPDQVDRQIHASDLEPLVKVLEKYFRNGFKQVHTVKTCLYTNTADENFIIDQLPGYKQVYIATGFSGHGFKFAAGIGEIMAELALDGDTGYPIGFLKADK